METKRTMTDKGTGMATSSSDNRFPPDVIRQALDRALDNLGPRLKPVLWDLLERECGATSFKERAPTLLQLEVALKSVFGDTSYIVLDWFLEELEKCRKNEG